MKHIIDYALKDGSIIGKLSTPIHTPFDVAGYGFVEYIGDGWHNIGSGTHKIDLASKTVVALTTAEMAARNAPTQFDVTALIANELAASDKTQMPDCPAAKSAGWAAYRQALRDLSKIASPTAANMLAAWPKRPDGVNPVADLRVRKAAATS